MRPLTIFATLLLLAACFSTPGERAELDEQVGRAAIDGARLDVRDGLAAVRSLGAGELTLWCSVPTPQGTLTLDTPGEWTVTLLNALPDAELVAEGPAGRVPVVKELGAHATTHRHRVTLPAGTTLLKVVTPDATDRSPFSVALMSDIQDAVDDVQDMFTAIEAQPDLRFLLGAGDLAQNGSRDELLRIQRELESFALPYYTTLGNHDIRDFGAWQELFGRGNFRFLFRGVQFTLLDSAAASIEPRVYDWLDDWLHQGRDRVHLVGMHIPPLDPIGTRNGGFGSRHEAGKLVERLAAGGVDLTLYGHIHSFYAFDNAGIPAVISGGGGAIPERLDGIGRHFVVIEVGADAGVLGTRLVEVE